MVNRDYDEDVMYWLGIDEDGNETDLSDDHMLPHLTDSEIRGLADGYDDGRINTLVQAYVQLRSRMLGLMK
jgi:hypothetical protein